MRITGYDKVSCVKVKNLKNGLRYIVRVECGMYTRDAKQAEEYSKQHDIIFDELR